MNPARLFSERAVLSSWRTAFPTFPIHHSQRPLARKFSILRPSYRLTANNPCSACRPKSKLFWTVPNAPIRRCARGLRFNGSKTTPNPNPTPHLGSPQSAPSLSQRLKKLSREYGWSALGVYFALSALDFPFCFLAVRLLGTERIGRWEHVVIEAFWKVVQIPFPDLGNDRQTAHQEPVPEGATAREGAVGWSSEVEQAEANNASSNASMC
jgi:hypothetical protein